MSFTRQKHFLLLMSLYIVASFNNFFVCVKKFSSHGTYVHMLESDCDT